MTGRLQIIHLATAHRPGDPRIFQKECRSLAAAGFRVSYVVPGDGDFEQAGIDILTVPRPQNGRARLTTTVKQVLGRAVNAVDDRRKAVLHAHDAELLPGLLWLQARGWRTVYDAHEDTPKQMRYQHWIPRALRPAASGYYRTMEALAGRWCEAIVAAEPINASRFPREKTLLLHNYPIYKELVAPDGPPYGDRAPIVVYVGSVTRVRGIREMMSAVSRVEGSSPPMLRVGGSFHPPELEGEVRSFQGNDRTTFLTYLDRQSVARELSRARIGIVTLHPTKKYLESYPTKLFEYMAAGLPVVVSDFPGWRSIVEAARCGIVVDPLHVGAISKAVGWLLENSKEAEAMGERGRQAVAERYNWEAEAPRLVALYDSLEART